MNPEIQYLLNTKKNYEYNLKNGIGHQKSIIQLLEKINEKLDEIMK